MILHHKLKEKNKNQGYIVRLQPIISDHKPVLQLKDSIPLPNQETNPISCLEPAELAHFSHDCATSLEMATKPIRSVSTQKHKANFCSKQDLTGCPLCERKGIRPN
jgi:hypothetical protein